MESTSILVVVPIESVPVIEAMGLAPRASASSVSSLRSICWAFISATEIPRVDCASWVSRWTTLKIDSITTVRMLKATVSSTTVIPLRRVERSRAGRGVSKGLLLTASTPLFSSR